MTSQDQKRLAADAAAAAIAPGMVVGLGTGSTAALFVRALAERQLAHVRCVATSQATAALADSLGLTVIAFDDLDGMIDLTVDGADEVGPGLALIKGAGAALLREKLVWEASRRCMVIADVGKRVTQLGLARLPVEVVRFGHISTARRMSLAMARIGIRSDPVLRERDGAIVLTDGGNVIYDVDFGFIKDPQALGSMIKALTGVVEHGLFLGLATEALIGTNDGLVRLQP